MIAACGAQLRMAAVPTPEGWITKPVGLDFGAVMLLGAGAGVNLRTLSEILPRIEAAIINPDEPETMEDDNGDT